MIIKSKILLLPVSCFILFGCGGSGSNNSGKGLPDEALSDTAKVAYMMKRTTPDSVARFICNTSLGLNTGLTLKSMQDAVLYAYERYKDDDLLQFSEEFDNYASSLPLDEKMTVLSKAALSDPDGLGYKLGLEYAIDIQAQRKTIKQIDSEMAALKRACGKDTSTYSRVLMGLSVALSMPEYSSLPRPILDKYGKAPRALHHKTMDNAVEKDAVATPNEEKKQMPDSVA